MGVIKTFVFILFILSINSLNNGLGLTPQMGWNTWNKFWCGINETLIKDSIDQFIASGLKDAGYKYINLDDCWQDYSRYDNGTIKVDSNTFPHGIKPLVDYAHSKGLLFGLYSSAGTHTCQGRAGSLDYEDIDAKTYAEWEIDYLKYDNCYNEERPSRDRYPKMRDALNKTDRPIFYSLCQWGQEEVATWAENTGNSWRTTGDISDSWDSMISIIDENDRWYDKGIPGAWNDPDMLEVGNGGMTITEYKTHFGLWAISKAPLLVGCDITSMREDIKQILTNPEVIAINQDKLGQQGHKIKKTELLFPNDQEIPLTDSQLIVTDCNGKDSQKWFVNDDGTIRNNNLSLCIDIPYCYLTDSLISTFSCHVGSGCANGTNELWSYNSEKKIQSLMVGGTDRCLRVNETLYGIVETHICNESNEWDYNEKDHTIKYKGKCLGTMNEAEIWAGNLSDGKYAVLLLNRASVGGIVELSFKDLGFDNTKVKLRDLWERKDLGVFEDKYVVYLASHDSQLLTVAEATKEDEEIVLNEEDDHKIQNIVMIALGVIIVVGCCIFTFLYFVNKNKNKKETEEKEKLIGQNE